MEINRILHLDAKRLKTVKIITQKDQNCEEDQSYKTQISGKIILLEELQKSITIYS